MSQLRSKIELLYKAVLARKLREVLGSPHPHMYGWHDGHSDHHLEHPLETDEALRKDEQHPHIKAHGPDLNEQAGGNASGKFHDIMGQYGTITPGKRTNLKFYGGVDQHLPDIENHVKQAGYDYYLAGGKHGKPDLANKNYNTKHLMIYDPSEGSGGDFGNEQFTKAWRLAHEKAHADTLPQINQMYGEGRRLGKLGVRSPREMKRAVHWEDLAAQRQREIMQGLGYNISDEDFNRERNTVVGDAVHRALTGQFTDPHEMGFYPHAHHVPIGHALGMIDAHAKTLGLRHEDDTLAALKHDLGKSEDSEESPVKVAVVLLYDGNFILVGKRRRNDKWALPGGRFEDDENKEEVAIRELEEEAGIKLSKEDLKYAGSKKIKNRQVYVFLAQYPGGETTLDNDPDEEFTEWQWIRCEDGKAPDWLLEEEINPPTKAVFKKLGFTKNLHTVQDLVKSDSGSLDETAAPLMNRQEDKFFVPASSLGEVTRALKEKLGEGDIDTSARYNVNRTTYLDNRDMDSFRDIMEGSKPRFKIRIRQYKPNNEVWEDVAYIEMKVKTEDGYTKKFRVRVSASEVDRIAAGGEINFDDELPGLNRDVTRDVLWKRVASINSVIVKCGFKKQVVVEYNRRAFSDKNIRITVDDSIRYHEAVPIEADVLGSIVEADNWKKMCKTVKKLMYNDTVILEVKHQEGTPDWVLKLIKDAGGKPVKFSKYFAAVTAHILQDQAEEGDISRQKNYDAQSIVKEIVGDSEILGKSEALFKAPLQYGYHEDPEKHTHDYSVHPTEDEDYRLVHEEGLPNGLKYRQYQHKDTHKPENRYVHTIYHPRYDENIAVMESAHNADDPDNAPNQVTWSEVHPLWRGKGLGRQVYLAALLHGKNMHEGLTSDSKISPAANRAWNSFKSVPGLGGKIGKYPEPNELLFRPGLSDKFENSLHNVYVRDPEKVPHGDIFRGTIDSYHPKSEPESGKLAASEKEVLEKPYRSEAQRRWAHSPSGMKALGGKGAVHHWDEATRGKHLPEKVEKDEPGHLNKDYGHHYLMWPVTINNEDRDPVTGHRYHITLRHAGPQMPDTNMLNHYFSDKSHLVPQDFSMSPGIFDTQNGRYHVLKLDKHPEWMQGMHKDLEHFLGPDKHASYIPHISVPKHMYDRFVSDPSSLKVKAHPLEMWKEGDVLWRAPQKLAASEAKLEDLRKAPEGIDSITAPMSVINDPKSSAEDVHEAVKNLEAQGWSSSTVSAAHAKVMNHPNTSREDRLNSLEKMYAISPYDLVHVGEGYGNMKMSEDQKKQLLSDAMDTFSPESKPEFLSHLLQANDPGTLPVDVIEPHVHSAAYHSNSSGNDETNKQLIAGADRHGVDASPKIEFKLGSNKLREVRDLAESSPDKKVHKSTLEQLGLKPSDLGIQKLQDGKGFISADKVQQHIDSLPSLRYSHGKTEYGEEPNVYEGGEYHESPEYEQAYDEHADEFDPEDYGVYRNEHLDEDEAKKKHMEDFDPSTVYRDDYSDDGKGEEEYQHAVNDARSEHEDKFDPDEWTSDDELMLPSYEKARERAEEQHNQNFRFDPSEHGLKTMEEANSDALDEQRHNHLPSQVFQLNLTKDQLNKLKEAGVSDTFDKMVNASYHSSHPVQKGKTIGWVRYTQHPEGIHIDEVQSDLGQSFARQAASHAKRAVQNGEMTPEQADQRVKDIETQFPEEHFKKISDIAFAGKDPNELIHEAFLQHVRNSGGVGKKMMIWQAKPKAKISNQNVGEELPAHMQRTYDQQPKKIGYKPAGKYGEMSGQDNDQLEGYPMNSMTLRKKEDDLYLEEKKGIL